MTSLILTCPSCHSRYEVDADDVLPAGRKVQCSHCAHVWHEPAPDFGHPIPPTVTDQAPPPVQPAPIAEQPPVPPEPEPTPAPPQPAVPAPQQIPQQTPQQTPLPPPPAQTRTAPPVTEPAQQIAEQGRTPAAAVAPPLGSSGLGVYGAGSQARPNPPTQTGMPGVPRGRRNRKGTVAFALITALVIILVNIAWFGREGIISSFPAAEGIYGMLGLEPTRNFEIVQTASRLTEGGVSYLQITGTIVNTGSQAMDLPGLIGRLTNSDGETVYQWNFAADKPRLEADESVDFTSRVDNPPEDTACLNIMFYEPRKNPGC